MILPSQPPTPPIFFPPKPLLLYNLTPFRSHDILVSKSVRWSAPQHHNNNNINSSLFSTRKPFATNLIPFRLDDELVLKPVRTAPLHNNHNNCPLFFTENPFANNLTLFRSKDKLVFKPVRCTAPQHNNIDIDMVQNKQGVYIPKQNKVVILWDLDNKPPRGPPYEAALSLKSLASKFGQVVDMSAYANRHAFTHLPTWVRKERRERRHLDYLEKRGIVTPTELYVCKVCGRKCKTNLDLKKHFKQLHERERQKKLSRMRQLKGKKRQKFKERYIEKNDKVVEAARDLIMPKVGYGLARELRRAGVFVKTVEDKPQAADWAVKRQMLHSMNRGIDWLFLVSDDSDFKEMLRKAREANLGTVVVGDGDRALGRYADLWVSWGGVESGEVSDEDLVPKKRGSVGWEDVDDGLFSISRFEESGGRLGGGSDLDDIVDRVVGGEIGDGRFSAFSEGEEDEEWDYEDDDDDDDDDEFDYEEEE